jgi:hypothetical protein
MNYISNYDHVNDINGIYYNDAMTIHGWNLFTWMKLK